MKNPLISVVMGVYYQNRDVFQLQRSLESILRQTVSDFEVLICDDGSSNEAKQYLDDMAKKDSRIRLLRRNNVFSLPSKLNTCLASARGVWIARMDDDDYSHPTRFAEQLDYLEKTPQIAFVGCCVNLICEDQQVGIRNFPEFPVVRDFYMVQPYIHPTLFFRREALEKIGGYSENQHCVLCEDYDLLLRMYGYGYQGANLQKVLFDYTIPKHAKGNRKMKHRWNEVVTRYQRFRDLHVLPRAFPYVVKPIVVGLIPERVLRWIKKRGRTIHG